MEWMPTWRAKRRRERTPVAVARRPSYTGEEEEREKEER